MEGVTIKGISCCVPKKIEYNRDISFISRDDIEKFIETTGVEERRIVNDETCTSDLCEKAAEELISNLNWKKNEIEILVFVSQTGDYLLPITAAILQDKLKLSDSCLCLDVPLGCSGYVYGIAMISSMMKSLGLKKC
jgi:3-oxoacyl-[acyl-carrier-protein] synthase-3